MEPDHGPGEEFHDVERRRLITRILLTLRDYEDHMGAQRGVHNFPIPTWFAMWLADLDRLKATVEAVERNLGPTFIEKEIPVIQVDRAFYVGLPKSGIADKLPKIFIPSCESVSATDTGPSTPAELSLPSDADADITEKYLKRDSVCILTKLTDPLNVSYIWPSSLARERFQGTKDSLNFLNLLFSFWSPTKVHASIHADQKIFESAANTITLAPHAHGYWNRALFALKPGSVNDEKTEMTAKFYWLKPNGPLPISSSLLLPEVVPANYIVDPIYMPGNLTSGGREHQASVSGPNLKLFNSDTDTIITSGDEIRIKTDDEVNLPLPDPQFISLQWTLHRLAALCDTAADQPEFEYEDEDDDPW